MRSFPTTECRPGASEEGSCRTNATVWRLLSWTGVVEAVGLEEFLPDIWTRKIADVPWSRVAAVLAVNRLCAPGSDTAIVRTLGDHRSHKHVDDIAIARVDGAVRYLEHTTVDRQHRGHAGPRNIGDLLSRCRAKNSSNPTASQLQSKIAIVQTVAFVLHEPSSLAPGRHSGRREAPHRFGNNFNCVLSPCSLKASMVFCQRAWPNRSAPPNSKWSVVVDHRVCGRSPPATNTRAPYRLCSMVLAQKHTGLMVSGESCSSSRLVCTTSRFQSTEVETKYFPKEKKRTQCPKSQCW